MSTLRESIAEAVRTIREKSTREPSVAIILGTGLDRLSEAIEEKVASPYDGIPVSRLRPSSTTWVNWCWAALPAATWWP